MSFKIDKVFLLLIFSFTFILFSINKIQGQATESWKLVNVEYPLLPHAILDIESGRGAGSFIKMRRTQKQNEVVYIRKSVTRGITDCHWISAFIWETKVPEVIHIEQEYYIDLEARFDRREGLTCGNGQIYITYGHRAEPLRDRAPNIIRIKEALAQPIQGGTASPISTEIFKVIERAGLPNNNMFTIAIHVSDGSMADEVVALYVYEKIRRY